MDHKLPSTGGGWVQFGPSPDLPYSPAILVPRWFALDLAADDAERAERLMFESLTKSYAPEHAHG